MGAIAALAVLFSSPSCSLGNAAAAVQFTIIESAQGYNGSKNEAAPWPTMTVHCGQKVTIHLENIDSSAPHGFSLDKYAVSQVVLSPGESHDVIFDATTPGSFRFFCTINCVPHPYMLAGKLIVTS